MHFIDGGIQKENKLVEAKLEETECESCCNLNHKAHSDLQRLYRLQAINKLMT